METDTPRTDHMKGYFYEGGGQETDVFALCETLEIELTSKQATIDTLREQLKADEKAAYDLRCLLHEVADHCGISTDLWPSAVADRLKQMKDDKDEIENMWEELTKAIGAHGDESDPLTGRDTNEDIHKRAMGIISRMNA